jgi:hypothetical protein
MRIPKMRAEGARLSFFILNFTRLKTARRLKSFRSNLKNIKAYFAYFAPLREINKAHAKAQSTQRKPKVIPRFLF